MVTKPLPTFRGSMDHYVSLWCSIRGVSPRNSSTCAVGTYNFICTKRTTLVRALGLQLTKFIVQRKSSSEAKVGDAHGS